MISLLTDYQGSVYVLIQCLAEKLQKTHRTIFVRCCDKMALSEKKKSLTYIGFLLGLTGISGRRKEAKEVKREISSLLADVCPLERSFGSK